MVKMPHPIIYINSWPGVGKHTIAKELEKQMDGRARVVHNHLHIDLAGSILERSSPYYLTLRRQLRSALFNTLATVPDTFKYTYVFTDFQTGDESGISVAKEYKKAAERRRSLFIPVILTCQPAENERRIQSPERLELVAGGKGMLLDTKILNGFRKRGEIHSFQMQEELVLDITNLQPAQAAARILKHVESVIRTSKVAEE